MLIGSAIACLQSGYGQIENGDLAEVIAVLQGSDYGARYEARMTLQDHVSKVSVPGMETERKQLEKQLVSLLEGDFPVTTQLWLLRQLHTIGSEASVDALASLLKSDDPHVVDGARMALEYNSSSAATDALIQGLDAAKSEKQILGFIDSLGLRGDGMAISSVVKHLRSENVAIANGAALALGKLGEANPSQVKKAKLHVNLQASSADKVAVEQALLRISRDWTQCSRLVQEGANSAVRAAAFQKCIDLSSGRSARLLAKVLAEEDFEGGNELLRIALLSGKSNVARTALKLVEEMDTGEQAVIVGSLATSGRSGKSEKMILSMAESESKSLKLQATLALGKVGSVASLPILLEALESKSRDLEEAAADSIGSIKDSRVDRKLMASARSGDEAERVLAIRGLSYRNSRGAADLLNEFATNDGSEDARAEAIDAMERIGNEGSITALVELIVTEPKSGGLRRNAQRALKRTTLRIGDPESAWKAMESGFESAGDDAEARNALLAVIDSAPTSDAIEYVRQLWQEGDETVRKTLLRTLPAWRNWDGGFLMLEFASLEGASEESRDSYYSGIGRLILSSDQNYSREKKFELATLALEQASSDKQKEAILSGFRNPVWRDRNYARYNEVAPELKELLVE